MTDDATKMKQERDLALAECERLRADAERYHMKRSIDLAEMLSLESLRESLPEMESVLTEGFLASYDLSIDAAIDAARAKP